MLCNIMPRIFYDRETVEITKEELDVKKLSDEDLYKLKEKYEEKLERYSEFLNEEKERTQRKVLLIRLEIVYRKRNKENE